jgi:hypothetical protein
MTRTIPTPPTNIAKLMAGVSQDKPDATEERFFKVTG